MKGGRSDLAICSATISYRHLAVINRSPPISHTSFLKVDRSGRSRLRLIPSIDDQSTEALEDRRATGGLGDCKKARI